MRSANSLIDTPCASGLGLAVDLGVSLTASLRLKNVGLSKVGRILAEAPDSLDAGGSAAKTPSDVRDRAKPASRAKAVNRGNARVGNMVEVSGIRLVFGT